MVHALDFGGHYDEGAFAEVKNEDGLEWPICPKCLEADHPMNQGNVDRVLGCKATSSRNGRAIQCCCYHKEHGER